MATSKNCKNWGNWETEQTAQSLNTAQSQNQAYTWSPKTGGTRQKLDSIESRLLQFAQCSWFTGALPVLAVFALNIWLGFCLWAVFLDFGIAQFLQFCLCQFLQVL